MVMNIRKQIDNLGEDKIREIQEKFTVGAIVPYPYQCVAYTEIGKRIARYEHPFILKASVSAGKTIILAMIGKRMEELGLPYMVLSRQAEIVEQDSIELRNMGVKNSVYCAGLGVRSVFYNTIVGSEGTVVNGLFTKLAEYAPAVIGVDECHMVDWQDLQDAIDNDESYEQMTTPKGEMLIREGEAYGSIIGTGRSQYTIIIVTLMRRCREVHGKELRIFGVTGSEFRGVERIVVESKKLPGFWRESVCDIDTDYLVEFGSVVPTTFGDTGGAGYDLSEFEAGDEDGVRDFTPEELRRMEKKIHDSQAMTKQIMEMVARMAETRNAVLITCAGQRHCKEAADALPPGSTYAIITEKTTAKKRREILAAIDRGEIKYTFQVNALTTGVNQPRWDFSVLLRKIGSLTLLIQLLGRGMRILKGYHKELGLIKDDHLVWDFAGTMDEIGALYFNPILEDYQYQSKNRNGKPPKRCPICDFENSFYARRCINQIERDDGTTSRCEHFWKFRECEDVRDPQTKQIVKRGCGCKNDIAARICRQCDETLIDPNLKLSKKMYRKGDWMRVYDFSLTLTNNQKGIIFNYVIMNHDGEKFKAREVFFPESDNRICHNIWKAKGVIPHVQDQAMRKLLIGCRSAVKIFENRAHFAAPLQVTHRRNAKGEDVIANKSYNPED